MFDLNALATVTIEKFEGPLTPSEIAHELEGELDDEPEADWDDWEYWQAKLE